MFILLVKFVLLSLVVIVAGTFLARFADRLGAMTGLGRAMSGMLLLAVATSLPELLVGCHAARIPAINLTLGDLFGSSLFNLLILAVLDLATHTRGTMLSKAAAAHALSATASILLTVIAMLFLVIEVPGVIELPGTSLRIGPGTLAVAAAYMFCLRLIFLDQQVAKGQVVETSAMGLSMKWVVTGYVVSAAAIFVVAPPLARTADELATLSGLGETFFGTLFVAMVTSLPEAVTTLTALRMRAVDLAVGNILGSNAFNMVILLGVDLAYDGSLLADASQTHVITAGAVILVTAVAVLGLLYRAEKRYWIIEPDALLVILLIVGAFGLIYTRGS